MTKLVDQWFWVETLTRLSDTYPFLCDIDRQNPMICCPYLHLHLYYIQVVSTKKRFATHAPVVRQNMQEKGFVHLQD